jgi:hypothetical protein
MEKGSKAPLKERAKELWLKSDRIIGIAALAFAGFGVAVANPAIVTGGLTVAGAQGVEYGFKKAYFNRRAKHPEKPGMMKRLFTAGQSSKTS